MDDKVNIEIILPHVYSADELTKIFYSNRNGLVTFKNMTKEEFEKEYGKNNKNE